MKYRLVFYRFFLLVLLGSGFCFGYAEEVKGYAFKGVHFVADYCDCDQKALTDVEKLKQVMHDAAIASGATILEVMDHLFPSDGLTLVILLSESHASIHTYPEHRACFVDLFTCGDHCSYERFDKVVRAYLCPEKHSTKVFSRTEMINVLDESSCLKTEVMQAAN